MVYTCFLCKWRSDKCPRRSYHKFPSNEELKQRWLDILGKSNVSIGSRTSLCSLHFEEGCFRYGLVNEKKILKDGSLPTLYLVNIQESTIDLVDKESRFLRTNPATDDVWLEDSSSEFDIEDNHMIDPIPKSILKKSIVEHSMKVFSPKGLCENSGPSHLIHIPPEEYIVIMHYTFEEKSCNINWNIPSTIIVKCS